MSKTKQPYGGEGVSLPRGAHDLLPTECRKWRRLRRELVAHVEAWGYQQIRTPLIEFYELLGRGLDDAESERCVRYMDPDTGKLIALRSDVTPQVARLVAQRVGGSVRPDDQIRLCYAAVTVAVPSHNMDGAEHQQIGIELIGETAPHGDAELIAIADEMLCQSGLDSHRVDLGETNILRTALARLPERLQAPVRELMSRKDYTGLVEILDDEAVDASLARAVAGLSQLYGDPQRTLERARETLAVLDVADELDRLAAVIAALDGIRPEAVGRLELDLGEARGHEYYTGFRLRVWAPGPGEPIVRGGRYDDLLGKYGAAMPASGLAVDVDALQLALEAAGVAPEVATRQGCLYALAADADDPKLRRELAGLARAKRAEGVRAWVELCADPAHAEDRATRTGAFEFFWRNADGPVVAYRATSDGGFERVASASESSE